MISAIPCCCAHGHYIKFIIIDACHHNAPLPGVDVTITDVATGEVITGTTDSNGVLIVQLEWGPHVIELSKGGCKFCTRIYNINNTIYYLMMYCTAVPTTITVHATGCDPFCPANNPGSGLDITVKQGTAVIVTGSTDGGGNFTFPAPDCFSGAAWDISWPAKDCCQAGSMSFNPATLNWSNCANQTIGIFQQLKPLYITDSNGTWPLFLGGGGFTLPYWYTGLISTTGPTVDPLPNVDETKYCKNDCTQAQFCTACPAYAKVGDFFCSPVYTESTKTSPNTGTGPISYYYQIFPSLGGPGKMAVSVVYNYDVVSTWDFNLGNGICTEMGFDPCNSCSRNGLDISGPVLIWIGHFDPYTFKITCEISNMPDHNWKCTAGYGGLRNITIKGLADDCPGRPWTATFPPPAGQGFSMSWNDEPDNPMTGGCFLNVPPPPGGTTVSVGC